jgi:hypothetical protein
MKQTPIKVGMRVVMTPTIGVRNSFWFGVRNSFWSACIGKIFEVTEVVGGITMLKPPKEAPQNSAMIGSSEIWKYFRPADQQLEFDFGK